METYCTVLCAGQRAGPGGVQPGGGGCGVRGLAGRGVRLQADRLAAPRRPAPRPPRHPPPPLPGGRGRARPRNPRGAPRLPRPLRLLRALLLRGAGRGLPRRGARRVRRDRGRARRGDQERGQRHPGN